jgi:hypothetical protein
VILVVEWLALAIALVFTKIYHRGLAGMSLSFREGRFSLEGLIEYLS